MSVDKLSTVNKLLKIIQESHNVGEEFGANTKTLLLHELNIFELEILHEYNQVHWDFWNAMLYAQTLCTTIGYGHLYTTSTLGRILTMIYSLIGIPLVLSILDDLGKVITICLRKVSSSPINFIKRIYGFLLLQGQHRSRLNDLDKSCMMDFNESQLSVRTTVFAIISWIGLCAAVSCIWEQWSYFEAFYFFFISLSTIGLGDIMPKQPKYLLLMFVKIIIGFSLVSICISSIQHALEEFLYKIIPKSIHEDQLTFFDLESLYKKPSSLGVFRGAGSTFSLNTYYSKYSAFHNNSRSKGTQTSFPLESSLWNKKMKRVSTFSRTPSFEDVSKMLNEDEERTTEETTLLDESLEDVEIQENEPQEPFNLLGQYKNCKCCLALARGSVVISRLLHGHFLQNNTNEKSLQCPLHYTSLSSFSLRKYKRLPLRERFKIKELEDQVLLLS
uniref:Potassium channel domain-containing protein n=1 Tax=Acrobeloides nanus TaxID=290746 RepID=A0A914C066_9BILA